MRVAIENFISENDRLYRSFGMQLEEAREGYAKVSALVRDDFLNAYGVAHGALIFALADVSFAIAAATLTDSLAVQWSMNMFRPALEGDTIVAESEVIHRGQTMMVVEFSLRKGDGQLVARGQATSIPVDIRRFGKNTAD
jgi:acyl-CoA thioesterase